MELKITSEKVLAAAAKCDTAKATLKVLFPEAFESETLFTKEQGSGVFDKNGTELLKGSFQIRTGGKFAYNGFYLSSNYKWTIENDGSQAVLVPKKLY